MKKLLLPITIIFIAGNLFSQINNGLIAHFPFDNNLNDISTSNISVTNHGTSFGADRNGTSNNALVCNGSTYTSFSDNSVKPSLPISISVWVYVNAFDAVTSTPIFYSDSDFGNYSGYMMGLMASGQVFLQFGGGIGNSGPPNRRTFLTNNSISTGTWYHIVGIMNAHDDMEVYVDCQKFTGTYNGTGPTTMVYTSTDSRIGGDVGNSGFPSGVYLDGSLDQLAIWDRELTPSEITFLCDNNNTLTINETSKDSEKELMKIIDFMGRETEFKPNTPLIYIYNDGSTKRVMEMK